MKKIITLLAFVFCLHVKGQTLYSISQTSGNADFLSAVNPMTGATTIISSTGLAKYVAQGVSTLDPINKRFFFMSTGDTLYTVDLVTGNLLAKNIGSLSGTYANELFEFNCQDSTLYTITQDVSSNTDFLAKVSPMTGVTTIISSTGLAKYVAQGVSTLDPINKRFFFMSTGDTLYTVDLVTGNLLAKNVGSLSGTYTNELFEFNCSDTTLYTITQDVNNVDFLAKVDPMTGATTIISSTGLAKYVAQGVSTIDPINKRFFFMSTGDTLYTVDLVTGNLLAKNVGSLSGTYTNELFEFEALCPVSSCTNVVSYTLTPNTAPHVWDAYPVYSPNTTNARWYWGDGTSTTGLYPSHTYSVAERYNICVTVYSPCGDSSQSCQNDTVFRLANNSISNTIIQVNVVNSTTSISQISGLNTNISIYPNPTNGSFVIEPNTATKQTVMVYDVTGKLVLSQTINGKTGIDASSLNEGVYNINIGCNEGVINKRIVIVK